MPTQLYRIVQSGDIETFANTNTGETITSRTLVLQDIGQQTPQEQPAQRYSHAFVVHTYGSLALCNFFPGDLVFAHLHFEAKVSNGGFWWQQVTASDLIKIA